jgi:hypothetical protein
VYNKLADYITYDDENGVYEDVANMTRMNNESYE